MNKLVITGLATVSLAASAFAQGGINLDSSAAAEGIVQHGISGPSASGWAFYSGAAGIQIWYLNDSTGATISAINSATPAGAYAALTADGYTVATTFTNATVTGGGFTLGDLRQPGISGTGPVSLAVVSWLGTAGSWNAAAAANGNGGVLAFLQTVNNYATAPTLSDPSIGQDLLGNPTPGGFNTTDLVANTITVPEPATFALAGLGAASLLIFRRRK